MSASRCDQGVSVRETTISLRSDVGLADCKTAYMPIRRLWTARRVLHNRRTPDRFLSHLPLSSGSVCEA